MKLGFAACVLVFLGGCASTSSVSPALSGMNNVEIGPGPKKESQYINKVSYKFDGVDVKGDALPICIARNVKNRSVTLRDSSNAKFVSHLGVVSEKSSRDVAGGPVIKYASKDGRSVQAEGSVPYQYTFMLLPMKESARFTLSAKAEQTSILIEFIDIEDAQLDTGYLSNDGYSKLGAWSGRRPELVVHELEKLAGRVMDCVKSS